MANPGCFATGNRIGVATVGEEWFAACPRVGLRDYRGDGWDRNRRKRRIIAIGRRIFRFIRLFLTSIWLKYGKHCPGRMKMYRRILLLFRCVGVTPGDHGKCGFRE